MGTPSAKIVTRSVTTIEIINNIKETS